MKEERLVQERKTESIASHPKSKSVLLVSPPFENVFGKCLQLGMEKLLVKVVVVKCANIIQVLLQLFSFGRFDQE